MTTPYWFLVIVEEISDEISDSGICLAEGFDEERGPDMDDVEYVLWWRACADSEENAMRRIADGLTDLGFGRALKIESIRIDPKRMIRKERRLLKSADEDFMSFHSMWIACKAGHEPARQMARTVMLDAMTRKPWQFWK